MSLSDRLVDELLVNSRTNILLMGPRASGKTTLGRLLAKRLSRSFVDLDHTALQRFSASTIAEVWRTYGEAAWREAEAAALDEVLRSQRGSVVALGGGTPMIPAAHDLLREARSRGEATLVYLRCAMQTLRQRLQQAQSADGSAASDRPPLLGVDAVEEVDAVMAKREPTYLRLADLVLDADVAAPEIVVSNLLEAIERLQT